MILAIGEQIFLVLRQALSQIADPGYLDIFAILLDIEFTNFSDGIVSLGVRSRRQKSKRKHRSGYGFHEFLSQ
jgi:hypothetical protein